MRKMQAILLVAALSIAGTLLAQETSGNKTGDPPQPEEGQTVAQDTSGSELAGAEGVVTSQPEFALKPLRSLLGHKHNKVIHVPIGFALSAFLLSLLALRWKEVQPAIRWLVLTAALGSLFAYLTGTNQASFLEGGSKDWVIELHETLGIATACVLWAWTATLWIRSLGKWALYAGILAFLLILITGFFGGVLAHG